MGKIREILERELVGGKSNNKVYPITHTKAVYDENNTRLDRILEDIKKSIRDIETGQIEGIITIDDELSSISENPVQNKVINAAIEGLNESVNKLIDKNFPLKVTLSTNTTSSASNALNSNAPKKITISWTLKYEGNSYNEDASKYFGQLEIGNTTIDLEGKQLGKGSYEHNVLLSTTTTITLTVNDKVGSTTVYFAKPMYSGCRALSQGAPNKLNELTQITPIATTIANMSNQNVTGLSTKYVYWIAIPDTLSITGAKDVNTGFSFPLELDSSVSIAGYKVYKSGGLAANTNWTIKISDN